VLRDKLSTFGLSFLIHAGLVAALAWLAVDRVRDESPAEIELVEFEVMPEVEPPAPAIEPPPTPEPPPIPTEARPAVVPEERKVVVVEKPTPLSPEGIDREGREAPEDTEAVARPTTPLVFAMDSEVGGGGGSADYVTSADPGGEVAVGAPGAGGDGTGGGEAGEVARAGASDVEVARDWQVTILPEPKNDREFEPDYPPLARREGREARVVVSLDVDTDGRVARAAVVSGPRDHGFREAALAYARKLRFEPARAGSKVVAARIDWTVHFHVRN
jgi:periplasmic protein TonB